jgi:hypothetical protein
MQVLLADACRRLHDDGAQSELDAARETFRHLGALPDLHQVEALLAHPTPEPTGRLSNRELEVLHTADDAHDRLTQAEPRPRGRSRHGLACAATRRNAPVPTTR